MKDDVESDGYGSARPEFRGRLFRLRLQTTTKKTKNGANVHSGGRSTGVMVYAPGARLASEPRATVASVSHRARAVLSG